MESGYESSLGVLRTEIEKSTATVKEFKSFVVVSMNQRVESDSVTAIALHV